MPRLTIHKAEMHYQVEGPEDGPWATMLPGAFTAPWQYDGVRAHLAAQGFRALTLDYRGIGQSTNDLWHVTPGQLADDVLRLWDHLGVERTHGAAISLGTFVLAELLHRAPARLDRCAPGAMPALRGTARLGREEAHEFKRSPLGQRPMQQLVAGLLPAFVSPRFPEEQPERYEAMVAKLLELGTWDLWAGVQQFYGVFGHDWGRTRVYGALPEGRRLFLTGEVDAFAPLRDAREHPLFALGPTLVFRRSGHLFFYERDQAYNAILAHFFRTGQPPPAAELPADVVPLAALPAAPPEAPPGVRR